MNLKKCFLQVQESVSLLNFLASKELGDRTINCPIFFLLVPPQNSEIYHFNIDDKCTVFRMLSDMITYFSVNNFSGSESVFRSSDAQTDCLVTDSSVDTDDRLCLIALCEKTLLPLKTSFLLSRNSLNLEIIQTLHFSLICIFAALKLQLAFNNRGPVIFSSEQMEQMPSLMQRFETLLISFVTKHYGGQNLLSKLLNCARKGSSFNDCYSCESSGIINGFVSLTSIIIRQVTESQVDSQIIFLPEKVPIYISIDFSSNLFDEFSLLDFRILFIGNEHL